MSADVFVYCKHGADPVDDVLVSLHPSGGGARMASGYTGDGGAESGYVFLGNRAEGSYEIHVTPGSGIAVVTSGGLQTIEVSSSEDPQVFDVVLTRNELPESVDPLYCLCSGYFTTLSGEAAAGMTIFLTEEVTPNLLVYNSDNPLTRTRGVLPRLYPTRSSVTTDANGYASVALLRGSIYLATAASYDNYQWSITVPDASFANLADVLFPYPDYIECRLDGSLVTSEELDVGEYVALDVTTFYRSGLSVDGASHCTISSSDTDICTAVLNGTTVVITGVSEGEATVYATPSGASVLSEEQSMGGSVSVTVNAV